jgi:hypothetical protein
MLLACREASFMQLGQVIVSSVSSSVSSSMSSPVESGRYAMFRAEKRSRCYKHVEKTKRETRTSNCLPEDEWQLSDADLVTSGSG